MTRVLWLDDEAHSEAMASRIEILSDSGIEIELCSDVAAFDRALTLRAPECDAVLVDMVMPPMDVFTLADTQAGTATGVAVIARIRETLPSIPIIVVSVRREADLRNRLGAMRVAEYVTKPCRSDVLIDAIRRAVSPDK